MIKARVQIFQSSKFFSPILKENIVLSGFRQI